MKPLGYLALGIVAGILVAMIAKPDPGDRLASTSAAPEGSQAQLSALRDDMAERFAEIDQRLAAMAGEIETLRSMSTPSNAGAASQVAAEQMARAAEARERIAEMFATSSSRWNEREVEQLLSAGFTQERIDWINRRIDERRLEAQQAWYSGRENGQSPTSETFQTLLNPRTGVRGDLGDAEYERYLQALGRPTGVGVQRVLANSPAEVAGLRAGDEIVSYDGSRIFHNFELTRMTEQGSADESVIVDVKRDGQLIQLAIPRGPVGIVGDSMAELLP